MPAKKSASGIFNPGKDKSAIGAFLFAVFGGPLGLIYATVGGGVLMTIIGIVVFIVSHGILGITWDPNFLGVPVYGVVPWDPTPASTAPNFLGYHVLGWINVLIWIVSMAWAVLAAEKSQS